MMLLAPLGSAVQSASQCGGAVPGQEVVDAIHGMIGDMRQHVAQPGFRGDTVQLGFSNKPIHGAACSSPLSVPADRKLRRPKATLRKARLAAELSYSKLYNHHIPQRALDAKTPILAFKEWQKKRPDYLSNAPTIKRDSTAKLRPRGSARRLRRIVGVVVEAVEIYLRATLNFYRNLWMHWKCLFHFRLMLSFVLALCALLLVLLPHTPSRPRAHLRRMRASPLGAPHAGFPAKKQEWVRRAVLALHERHPDLSHRKLKDAFNQRYFAATGMSVGRTWVRDLLAAQAHAELHARQACKHRVPDPEPGNRTWGLDTTTVTDSAGRRHVVLGIVDHGSRLNIALRRLRRFNTWTLLGALFLAFGEYGVPDMLRLDNHPVHRARRVKSILRRFKVRLHFTSLASPWQNGRIERLFGTLKAQLRDYAIRDLPHLARSLDQFRFWYNAVRPHQHLGGRTPAQVRHGIDRYRVPPKRVLWYEAWNGRLRGWLLRH